MENEIKKLLIENLEIAKENNNYLRKIDRRQRVSTYWKVFLFILTVGSALGLYYFLDPYIQTLSDSYGQIKNQIQSFNNFGK
jgi:hypothetical protein